MVGDVATVQKRNCFVFTPTHFWLVFVSQWRHPQIPGHQVQHPWALVSTATGATSSGGRVHGVAPHQHTSARCQGLHSGGKCVLLPLTHWSDKHTWPGSYLAPPRRCCCPRSLVLRWTRRVWNVHCRSWMARWINWRPCSCGASRSSAVTTSPSPTCSPSASLCRSDIWGRGGAWEPSCSDHAFCVCVCSLWEVGGMFWRTANSCSGGRVVSWRLLVSRSMKRMLCCLQSETAARLNYDVIKGAEPNLSISGGGEGV